MAYLAEQTGSLTVDGRHVDDIVTHADESIAGVANGRNFKITRIVLSPVVRESGTMKVAIWRGDIQFTILNDDKERPDG